MLLGEDLYEQEEKFFVLLKPERRTLLKNGKSFKNVRLYGLMEQNILMRIQNSL